MYPVGQSKGPGFSNSQHLKLKSEGTITEKSLSAKQPYRMYEPHPDLVLISANQLQKDILVTTGEICIITTYLMSLRN